MPQAVPELAIRDIHLPSPVAWWPLAPGWWLLLALVVILGILALLWRRQQRKKRFKKQALAQLQRLHQDYRQHYDQRRYLVSVSEFLRRLAVSVFPRRDVAGLTGTAWIEFLDQTLLLANKPSGMRFDGEIGRLLLRAPYSPRLRAQQVDMDSLEQLLHAFIDALPDSRHDALTTRRRSA